MRVRATIAAAAALLAVGCSTSTAASTETPTEQAAATIDDWPRIRAEHINLLLGGDCKVDLACNLARSTQLQSLRAAVDELPRSKPRSDILASIDKWNDRFEQARDDYCFQPGAKSNPDCTIVDTLLDTQMTIVANQVTTAS